MKVSHRTLARFVRESNALSRIEPDPHNEHDPLFEKHFATGRRVIQRAGLVPGVREISELHKDLLEGIDERAGKYRRDNTCVGGTAIGHEPPEWCYVSMLMGIWMSDVQSMLIRPPEGEDAKAQAIFDLHAKLICIAPFERGNARAARLVYNWLRLHLGLEWYTFSTQEGKRERYFVRLREFHDRRFVEAPASPLYPLGRWGAKTEAAVA